MWKKQLGKKNNPVSLLCILSCKQKQLLIYLNKPYFVIRARLLFEVQNPYNVI